MTLKPAADPALDCPACSGSWPIPVGVKVLDAPDNGSPRKDQWLEVTGTIVRIGDQLGIRPQKTTTVAQPAHPYLSFAS